MNQNRICCTSANRLPQYFIRRSEIAYDERLPFIESILETLLESRFGPGGVYQSVLKSSDCPEPVAAFFFDVCNAEPHRTDTLTPYYAISPLGRAGYQVVEAAYRRAKQIGLLAANPNARNSTTALTPNQGRGSP